MLGEKIKEYIFDIIVISLFGLLCYSLIKDGSWWTLTFLVIGLLVLIGGFLLIAFSLEAGMRQKFPLDYKMQIHREIAYFESIGFKLTNHLHPGTEKPGVELSNQDSAKVYIWLNAPLDSTEKYYSIEICDAQKCICSYRTHLPDDKIQQILQTASESIFESYSQN